MHSETFGDFPALVNKDKIEDMKDTLLMLHAG